MGKIEELSSGNPGRKQWLKDGAEARAEEILEESGEDLKNNENREIALQLAEDEMTNPKSLEGGKVVGEIEKMEEEEYHNILEKITELRKKLQDSEKKFPFMKQVFQELNSKLSEIPKRELREKYEEKERSSGEKYASLRRNRYTECLMRVKSSLENIELEHRKIRDILDPLKDKINQLLINGGSVVSVYRLERANTYWSDIKDKFVSSGRNQFEGASSITLDPNDFSKVTSSSHFDGENFKKLLEILPSLEHAEIYSRTYRNENYLRMYIVSQELSEKITDPNKRIIKNI